LSQARIVLTDSGGVQEETTALGIPCLTLRENTERPVTVTRGTSHIVGQDFDVTGVFGTDVVGIDTGITMVMAENARTSFVWDTFMKNPEARRGMERAGFKAYLPAPAQQTERVPPPTFQTRAQSRLIVERL